MTKFKIGQSVMVLDQPIEGEVVGISGVTITVLTHDGFTIDFDDKELIFKPLKSEIAKVAIPKIEKEVTKKKMVKVAAKNNTRDTLPMLVDLHIEKLISDYHKMSNFDILNYQLETAKRQLEFAINRRIPKLVFIHGVGEGVLKEEIRTLLRRYPVRFEDANYRLFGLGATMVYVMQNPKH